MEQIIEMIKEYGLETVMIALLVNVLTGFVKIPIKLLSKKMKDSTKLTRLIVFLPIGFSLLISFLYTRFIVGVFNFDRTFITMWLTSGSLSLTFYAIFEKLFPSKKKILDDCEIKTSEKILENIKQLVEQILPKEAIVQDLYEDDAESNILIKEEEKENKIILRGKINAEVNVEK